MEACQEDLRGRCQGLSAELDALSRELDALSGRSGALGALRADATGNSTESLCQRIRAHVSASALCLSLDYIWPLVNQCCEVTTQTVSADLIVKIEGCEALQQVKAVLVAGQGCVPGGDHLLNNLSAVVMALRSGVFTRLIDAGSLTAGGDIFERYLSSACTGMSNFTDCLCTLINISSNSTEEVSEWPTCELLNCVHSWVEALVGLGSSVVNASKEAPNELRSGMVLTKVWKEIARMLQAVPADSRVALSACASSAFTTAWQELQKCIRSLVGSEADKHSLNEKLCRFWMQNCGKLINEVPPCIAAVGDQVWNTAHMLYAALSVAPALRSPEGAPMTAEQRQLLRASLSQHLLPRIQVCAEQALSYMPEESIQQKLQELASCSGALRDVEWCLIQGVIPEQSWPAAVAAGGLHLLAVTLAHSQQWPSLRVPGALHQGFSSLCQALHGISSVQGASQVDPAWPTQLAPHLSACLLSFSELHDGGAGPADHWAAFLKLCECSGYLQHAAAACTVSLLCCAQSSIQPQFSAALSRMFWSAARHSAACMLETQACDVYAHRFMDAVALCRCSLLAAVTDESRCAMQHLQQQLSPHGQTTCGLLFNPVSCLAASALLVATSTNIAYISSDGTPTMSTIPLPVNLLEDDSVSEQLMEQVCSVLQWQLECIGEQDTPADTVLQGNVLALLSLAIALAGGWSHTHRPAEPALACSKCIPLCVCSTAAQLCSEKRHVASEALQSTVELLLAVVCEGGCNSEGAPQLLLRIVQQALSTNTIVRTHGLHARALASLAAYPLGTVGDCSPSQFPEPTVLQCWEHLFTYALNTSDSRALAVILPWFAEFCRCCAGEDFTQAVPRALLCAKRASGPCRDEPLFLALLQRAQAARTSHGEADSGAAGQGRLQQVTWIPDEETAHATYVAVPESLARCSAAPAATPCTAGGSLWQQVHAAVKCHLKGSGSERSQPVHERKRFVGEGKENLGAFAGNQGHGAKDWSDLAARDNALRDALHTLQAVQQGEQACGSSRSKALLTVCSQLQALLGGD